MISTILLVTVTLCLLFLNGVVNGAASGPLLGGRYQPTTDVSKYVGLSELINAIHIENDITNGTSLYKLSPLGISLESLTYTSPTTSTTTKQQSYLSSSNNPLYNIYQYAYYRSSNGSGGGSSRNTIHQTKSQMTFLNSPISNYAHTIITDEYKKTSGYDSTLTSETIKVMGVWMSVVQSLYNAVTLCDEGIKPDIDDGSYVNPIDVGAALYIGNLQSTDSSSIDSSNSLYAWIDKASSNFEMSDVLPTNVQNVLQEGSISPSERILNRLIELQTLLPKCWQSTADDNDDNDVAQQMRMKVDDLTKLLKIPLVQNLIYYSASVATGVSNGAPTARDTIDWVILYGLATTPQIIICDETAFDSLYLNFITNAKSQGISRDTLYDSLIALYSRLICLGLTCNDIGIPKILLDDTSQNPNNSWPTCFEPSTDFKGYQGSNPNQLLEWMKIDLDIRSIGTLIEMEASTAAYDIHHWGYSSRDITTTLTAATATNGGIINGKNIAIQDIAMQPYHPKNKVGEAFANYLTKKFPGNSAVSTYADTHEYQTMMGLETFADGSSTTTNTQRRVMTEATMVTITLHIAALNSFYNAIDDCRNGKQETTWDRGFAYLSGWAEETEDASGFLFMRVAKFLCQTKSVCDVTGDSYIKKGIMSAIEGGKSNLASINQAGCTAAEEKIDEIELLLQTILVDATAFFTAKIAEDGGTDQTIRAEGYSLAVALVPLMQSVDDKSADVLEKNLAVWGPTATPLVDGKDEVFSALKSFVTLAGIDCCLLTMNGAIGCDQTSCDGQVSLGGPTSPVPQDVVSSPTQKPVVAAPTTISTLPNPDPSDIACSWPGVLGSGAPPLYMVLGSGAPPLYMVAQGNPTLPLLGGAYTPTSNVDRIVQLTDNIEQISSSTSYASALSHYRKVEDGTSLHCLSSGSDWDTIIKTNPLYLVYMYGLWNSDDGDNDGDGYSNKKFDDGAILNYGDTIVMDEFNKKSGFDADLTAETIRVMNMWMAAVTEVYSAAKVCQDGMFASSGNDNPIDNAAAFWFGNAKDPESLVGGSLYAWAKRSAQNFKDQQFLVREVLPTKLTELQKDFQDCKALSSDQTEVKGIEMKRKADEIAKLMAIPIIQRFIHHLATESGLTDDTPTDERNYMVLYALATLPYISICDEETFDDAFSDLILNIDSYDTQTFTSNLKMLQDRYECIGITCDMIGTHISNTGSWPECSIPSRAIAGYQPTSDSSLEILKIDLDISTILSFIIMEANDAALDIYNNGRYARSSDGVPMSLKEISIPSSHPDAIAIYESFTALSGSSDYASVTKDAILGEGVFSYSSVLKNSAAASLSIATIDLHMTILDNMYQAISACEAPSTSSEDMGAYWDRAVAATVGWTEGIEDGGSDIDGYLFYQLAQELCDSFDSCDADGQSVINRALMTEFKMGQENLKNGQCQDVKANLATIENLIQAILVDNLAYHSKFVDSNPDTVHCLSAYVAASALVPLVRRNTGSASGVWANTIENNVVTSSTSSACSVDDVEAIYLVLNDYATAQGIDCSWLGSSVCDGESNPVDSIGYEDNGGYTEMAIGDDHKLLNGQYVPLTEVRNVQDISLVVGLICNSDDSKTALDIYRSDVTSGVTIEEMSINGKYVMKDELQFNQYVYALQDSVDKTAGVFLFDNEPATEYADTIVSDAMEMSIDLGCRAVKVLNIWMWIVHHLNTAVDECRSPNNDSNNGHIDEAAALWEGSQLFAMAQRLGPSFGHAQIDGFTYLNRNIVSRFVKARDIVSKTNNQCTDADIHDLRITVKETVSFMTAVLIQEIIDAMLSDTTTIKTKQEVVELMAFAVTPHISTCGHSAVFRQVYDSLVTDGFSVDTKVGDIISQLQSHYNCLGLTCDDVGRHNKDSTMHPECSENLDIAGYTPVDGVKTNMLAKLDLDAVAIHQLMVMDQHDVAKRIYMEGHNYYDYNLKQDYAFVSLYNLTQSNTIDYTDFPAYQQFSNYYGDDFSHELLIQIFDATGPFVETSTSQRELAVNYAISGIISYMSALEALYFSVSRCGTSGTAAIDAFDGAVALLIGSVEGRGRGGSTWQEGQMFYSIAKRNCLHFRNCRGGDSEVNAQLLQALTNGQDLVKQGTDCSAVSDAVKSIEKLLAAPLLQSLLYFSDARIADHEDNAAAAYVASEAVLPIVDSVESPSAESIKSVMSIPADSARVETVPSALTSMFQDTKASEVVDCSLVTNDSGICKSSSGSTLTGVTDSGTITSDGSTPTSNIDDEDTTPQIVDPDKPMSISNGLYVATNFVGDRSAISKDLEEIKSFLDEKDSEGATHTYTHGLYSKIYNENGIPTGEVRSIAKFSQEAASTMKGDPTYNLFVYGLSDEYNEFMGRPATTYADTFISNLLLTGEREAANSMVALTLWMQVAHSLHSAYGACKQSFLTDGRTTNGRYLQQSDPSLYIDEAAAYWIGEDQETGSYSGHLLYGLTEFIGGKFEDQVSSSESDINNQVIDLFNKAKNHIAISRGCSTSEDSHLKLKSIIDELIPMMAVPLLRSLIYYINIDDPIMVKVYAMSVLPLFSACAPSTYYELKTELIDHSVIEIQKEYLLSKIESMYSCLGLTCDLVGSPAVDKSESSCVDSEISSLAGYRYDTEQEIVNRASHIDVDMKKIEILIENGMNHFPNSQEVLFGTAFDLYKYGQRAGINSKGSLSSIARDTTKDVVPVFAAFRRYYNSDAYYADTMIQNAFQKQGVFKDATVDQRKRFITFALRYMVTFMAILEKIYNAKLSCSLGRNSEDGIRDLDIAVGYYVGSLEGKEDGGSYDGSLIHMLAKRMCVHFGTCTSSGHAWVNERIISLFYAAQGEVETGACDSLDRTVKEIESALIVPLIQGILFSAKGNELHYKGLPGQEFYPEGYALAQSILPVIDDADQSAATNIKNVMVASFPGQEDDKNSNNSARVHRAMKQAILKMDIDCTKVGSFNGYGFCAGQAEPEGINSALSASLSLMTLVATSVFLFCIV